MECTHVSRPMRLERGRLPHATVLLSIAAVVIFTFLPRASYHFFRSATWIHEYAGAAFDILFFIAIAVSSVFVAAAYGGRRIKRAPVIQHVTHRWATAGCAALVSGLIIVGLEKLIAAGFSEYDSAIAMGSSGSAIFDSIGLLLPIFVAPVYQLFRLFCAAFVLAAILEAQSVGEAGAIALRTIFGKMQIAYSIALCVAFSILYWCFNWVALASPISLSVSRLPILDTVTYLVTSIVPFYVVVVATVLFYIDTRLTMGVDVPAKLVSESDVLEPSP
jgi:hypothetical protein